MFACVSRSVVAVSCCAPRLVHCCTFTKKPATLLLLRSLPHTLLYQHQRPHSVIATMASAATSSTGAATSTAGSAAPRLVIHFDVNQTVIFTDEAAKKTLPEVIGESIAFCSWGLLQPSTTADEAPTWTLAYDKLSYIKPSLEELSEAGKAAVAAAGGAEVWQSRGQSYGNFIRRFKYKRPKLKGLTGKALAEGEAQFEALKRLRTKANGAFATAEGPGAIFEGKHKELCAALEIPAAKRDACAAATPLLASGYRFLSPAYFRTIMELDKAKRDFAVVFRTFGTDGSLVTEEHNMFCEGRHPLYPGCRFDGTAGSIDRRVAQPAATGRIDRTHDKLQLATVVDRGCVDLITGYEAFAKELQRKIDAGRRTIVLRDCYEYWNANDRHADAAKPLVVDTRDGSVVQVFFDDHVEEDSAHIVDVRDAHTGEVVDFDTSNEVYIVRAKQIETIGDETFFLTKLAQCESKQAALVAASLSK